MTVNKKMLAKFCARKDSDRSTMEQPFSQGEFTYATNGHVLVRVARMKSVPEVEGAPDAEGLFRAWDEVGSQTGIYVALPKLPRLPRSTPDHERMVPMKVIGDEVTYYDHNYLALIAELPSVTFGARREGEPAHFTFDGGRGLLMPMKRL